MTAANRIRTLLVSLLALLSPLYAQHDVLLARSHAQTASERASSDRRLTIKTEVDSANVAGKSALSFVAEKVEHNALQPPFDASLPQSHLGIQRQRRLPALPVHEEEVPTTPVPRPRPSHNLKKLKGDRKAITGESNSVKGSKSVKSSKRMSKGIGDASSASTKVKGESKKASKGSLNEPAPTKPNNRPNTPTLSPASRPVVQATPFAVRYLVGRRLSERRRLQTSDDFFEAAEVTTDYLVNYITSYFRKRAVIVSGVDANPTTFSADPLQIGFEVTVTFKGPKRKQSVVDQAIVSAIATDGNLLVDKLQRQLPEKNPFSQVTNVNYTPIDIDTEAPTFEPTESKSPSIDSSAVRSVKL
jgi:hypothetical protein